MVGSDYVQRQPADGHTILLAATNNLVMNQFLFKDQKLDPLTSFIPVAKIATVPLVIVVNSSLPINNLSELVEYIRKHPESTNFNSPSMGTMPHIAGEVFLETLGLRATHMPYRGGGGMATALGSGEVQFAVIGYTTVQSVISSGRVRPLVVIARERLKVLEHVPTVAQAGYPQLLDAICLTGGRLWLRPELRLQYSGTAFPTGKPAIDETGCHRVVSEHGYGCFF